MTVSHTKESNIVWNCVKSNIFKEKDEYKAIGLRGFDYKTISRRGRWGGLRWMR